MELTRALISSIRLHYLLDCDYLLQYEVGITLFYYLFYMESHMSLTSAIAIGAFLWISQVILTKLSSNIINLNQVEIITCKNVVFCCCCISFLKGAYTLFLLYYFLLQVSMVTLCGQPLIQTKGFLILKSIFSLKLCQVLQGCLLFLKLDMFFMATRL